MNKQFPYILLFFILTTFIMTGCTGSAYLNTFVKPPESIYHRNDLKLLVNGGYRLNNLSAYGETQLQFEEILLESLRNRSRYQEISLVKDKSIDNGDLLMVVTIDHVNYVSTGARLVSGVFAGTANFKTRVELYQDSPENRISEMICGTTSKVSQGVFGASTDYQMKLVAEKIAEEFSKKASE
ncbi:MAG: hypothetical protein KZQ73_03030 [Candidatus Thiodiazotropha sp. (ex Semelilucina semeliformis)]|nr:hypothetical protein [Candidatus Thiodiazotropha sp. (ex Semelilucina semeliformis)]